VIARRLGHGGPQGLKPHFFGQNGMAEAMPSRFGDGRRGLSDAIPFPFCCYRGFQSGCL
jgi:hypothetical protein